MPLILTRPVVVIGGEVLTPSRVDVELDNDPDLLTREQFEGEDGSDLDGWWALRYKRHLNCECGYSGRYAHETTGRHRVIVWPDPLDPNLRKMADGPLFDEAAPYERSMGRAVSFYVAHPS